MNGKNRMEFFEEQLERTNYWLSFAEAKNGALIAINIAMASVIINLIDDYSIIIGVTLIALIISSSLCVWSFIPDNATSNVDDDKSPLDENEKEKNLLFWGDIASLPTSGKYAKSLVDKYFFETREDVLSELEKDYVDEIYTISRIACKKYNLFKKAVYIDIVSCIMCIMVFVIVA